MTRKFTLLSAVSLLPFIALSVSPNVLATVNADVTVTAQHLSQLEAKNRSIILVRLQEEDLQEETEDNGDEDNAAKDGDKKEEPKFKEYNDVIKEGTVTQTGVFTTHLLDGKVYFEIPANQLDREFVWQVKVAAIQTEKGIISADSARQYVYFERIGDHLMLRARDYSVISNPDEPETFVVNAADLDAVLMKLPIFTFGEDDTPVVDVTAAFLGGVKGLEGLRDYKMDAKASLVKNVKSFKRNVEARTLGLFSRKVDKKTKGRKVEKIIEHVTAEIRHSILALPDTMMKPRHYNHRVGFFDAQYKNYSGDKNKVETQRFIKRWRLIKKAPVSRIKRTRRTDYLVHRQRYAHSLH
jgi:hypothetical protein